MLHCQQAEQAKAQGQSEHHLDAAHHQSPPAGTIPNLGLQEPPEASKGQASGGGHQDVALDLAPEPSTIHSKRIRLKEFYRELYNEFCFDPTDTTVFMDKEIAQSFDKVYATGNFHHEIRYYYIPAHLVQLEQKLFAQHQQKDILGLISSLLNELTLKGKLMANIDQNKDQPDLSLAQLGESILQSSKLLQAIESHLAKCKLVHKRMIPWPKK